MVAESGTKVGDRDGGVSLRLGRRCRLAATVLLAVGAAVLLAVVLTSWGLVSAVATLIAGALVIGAVFLARQAALWTSTRLSVLPDAAPPSDQVGSSARLDATARAAAAESLVTSAPSDAVGPANPKPQVAIVGPPRPLSPPKPGAPIKRRLSAVVVPVHLDSSEPDADQSSAPGGGELSVVDNFAPGGGALIVHARSDTEALRDGDRVLVWHLGRHGIDRGGIDQGGTDRGGVRGRGTGQGGIEKAGVEKAAVTGRFVLLRESDGQAFLATTRLTDTW